MEDAIMNKEIDNIQLLEDFSNRIYENIDSEELDNNFLNILNEFLEHNDLGMEADLLGEHDLIKIYRCRDQGRSRRKQ